MGDYVMIWIPGKLVMMVGPSCAGKSTWVRNRVAHGHCFPDAVISTDNIRQQIYGDFTKWDESKQQQVNGAALSQAVARINHGLDVVYDATNIRWASRQRILAAMPIEMEIEYLVMDRPLQVKRRQAGWRAATKVNGVPLIDYHHRIMLANLTTILAGDGDPRVVVEDMRVLV